VALLRIRVGRAVPAKMRLDLMESKGFLAAVRRAEPDLRKIDFPQRELTMTL
jgi:hypothetical protein